MDPLFIFASIARTVAGVLVAPGVTSGATQEWAGYLGLAATLVSGVSGASPELQLLDDQLKEAVAAGRGLTPEQRAEWKAKSDLYSSQIQDLRDGIEGN